MPHGAGAARGAGPTSAWCTSPTRRSPRRPGCGCCPDGGRRELLDGHGRPPRLRVPLAALGAATSSTRAPTSGCSPGPTFVAPLGPDPADLEATAAAARHRRPRAAELDELVGDRPFLVRVDRHRAVEERAPRASTPTRPCSTPSPSGTARVVFGAFVLPVPPGRRRLRPLRPRPSRRGSPRSTSASAPPTGRPSPTTPTTTTPARSPPWQRADVVLVNPIRDGLNLVAKEAVLLNRARRPARAVARGRRLGRARRRGAWRADPFDVGATAAAIGAGARRARRASGAGGRRCSASRVAGPHPGALAGRPARRRRLTPVRGRSDRGRRRSGTMDGCASSPLPTSSVAPPPRPRRPAAIAAAGRTVGARTQRGADERRRRGLPRGVRRRQPASAWSPARWATRWRRAGGCRAGRR